MTDSGRVGPLDVWVPKSDEIFESQVGLASMQSLATLQSGAWEMYRNNLFGLKASTVGRVTLSTASETATALRTALYGSLFGQVDPACGRRATKADRGRVQGAFAVAEW